MPLPAVMFNKDTVKLDDNDVRPNVNNIDFHVPGGDAVVPKSTPILDGRSTECLVKYHPDDRGNMPTETFKVDKDMEFPDYVEVSIHGPQEDPKTKKHYLWGTASDGTNSFEAKWIKQ